MAGNGSLRTRGNNSWELTVSLGKGPEGKYIKRTRTVKAKNKTEAKELLRQFIYEIETGEYIKLDNILLVNGEKNTLPAWQFEHSKGMNLI